jgi:molybdate transport system substrate-binding protein
MSRSVLLALLIFAAAWPAAGCGGDDRPELLVAAAADLQFAFPEVGALFEEECGCRVTFTFGSSGNLTEQVKAGHPADVFAAANVDYADELREEGLLIDDTQQLYALGRIVLAVNKDSGLRVSDLQDLLSPEVDRIALANPEHAPYGIAAMEALQSVGLWDELKPKLVYGENVRQATQYVQSGDAPVGLIALSVADVPEISYVLIDDSLHEPIRQAIAVLRSTHHEQLARDFIAFVNGPKGRPVMEKYGFLLPGED